MQYLGGEIEAEAVVLAAPLPALRDVEFESGLAAPLPAAIEELGYATHVKTFLQYDERFWLDLELSGDTITDLPLGWIWDATDSQSGDAGILITCTSGSFGEQFAQMDPENRVQTAVAQVEEIYPGSQARLITAESAVWVHGPYLFSGFSNYQPGQMTEFWDAFRQPHDGIYFAGEQTDIFVGYMEGAVRSGQRVATQILAD